MPPNFRAELVFAICEAKDVEVLIINKGVDTTFEEDLVKNVLEITPCFLRGFTVAARAKIRNSWTV